MSVKDIRQVDDPRARRTIRQLQKALVTTAADKPVAQVEVVELCAMARVHRTTFYKHFRTVSDLACCLGAELFDHVTPKGVSCRDWVRGLLNHVVAHRRRYAAILGPTGDAVFTHAVCRGLAGHVEASLDAPEGASRSRSFALAIGYAILGLVQGALADEHLDIDATVTEFVDQLPPELRAEAA